MLVSTNWIKEYVDLSGLDLKELINRFTLSTAEVEDVFVKGADISKVVVAEILSVEKLPDFKKLSLLKANAGDGIRAVVCGAPNVRKGAKVALALAGGRVPAGKIEVAEIAGLKSEGMCCSEKELGISDDHSGILELEADAPVGADIKSLYPIEDLIFEIDNKSLTNRPDLWGHYGIAREFAAITGRKLKPLELGDISYDGDEKIEVEIARRDLAYRYSCIKMDNITVKKSPPAMRIRLYYCGMRAVNPLADATNYVMLETGQPTHAFDADKIDKIVVDSPKEKIKFTTLDGVERLIDEETLVIYNAGKPVAIAGIMGGLDSEITEKTKAVVLESANFDAASVRKSASRLGRRTDASARYEKTLDPELTLEAIGRFVKLVKDMDSGARVASKLTDEYVKKYPKITIPFDKAYLDRYTGIDISDEQIVGTLVSLDFGVKRDGGNYVVEVPSWRATKDVTIKADVVEEITRIYGYDNFKTTAANGPLKPLPNDYARMEEAEIKEILVKKYGLHEVHTYIWNDARKLKKLGVEAEDNVKILNVENSENAVLRKNLAPVLLTVVNENKDFASDFGVFEIGRVVDGTDKNGKCRERKRLGAVLYDKNGDEKKIYFQALDIINRLVREIKRKKAAYNKITPSLSWRHPKNTAEILVDGKKIGELSALSPSVRARLDKTAAAVCFEIDAGDFEEINAEAPNFKEPSSRQSTYCDLSLVLTKGTKYSDISACWESLEIPELESVDLIDSYEKEGLKSATVRLFFAAMDRNLEMDEVRGILDKIIANLKKIGVSLRA